jgi:hypothetical protein
LIRKQNFEIHSAVMLHPTSKKRSCKYDWDKIVVHSAKEHSKICSRAAAANSVEQKEYFP